MKYIRIILIIVAPLLFAASAWSQTTDWKVVKDLPLETKIHVTLKSRRTFGHCFFEGIRDDGTLICRRGGPLGLTSRPFAYPRDSIKAVYLAHNGPLIGAGVGAGAGAIIGAAKPGCCRGASALIGAGLMAMPGLVIGAALDPFFHGKAVYRSPKDPGKSRNNSSVLVNTENEKTNEKSRNRNQTEVNIPCLRDGDTYECVKEPPTDKPVQGASDR